MREDNTVLSVVLGKKILSFTTEYGFICWFIVDAIFQVEQLSFYS